MVHHPGEQSPDLAGLVADGTLDADLAALLWLLAEGGVPIVVAGGADPRDRASLAGAVLGTVPHRHWVLLDADDAELTLERLAGLMRGEVGLGLSVGEPDLRSVLARLGAEPGGLPADAVRRLGVVLILDDTNDVLRAMAVHYLRPTERDAEGHVQRRPPAVLATWNVDAGRYEHFAWGITPELGDRIDRAQADLEERQHDRAAFLTTLVSDGATDPGRYALRITEYLATEPPRQPAPTHAHARPSPFQGGLADPHIH